MMTVTSGSGSFVETGVWTWGPGMASSECQSVMLVWVRNCAVDVGLRAHVCCFSPEGDVYKAHTPSTEGQGAPEVKEDRHIQVEVPVDQVGHAPGPPPPNRRPSIQLRQPRLLHPCAQLAWPLECSVCPLRSATVHPSGATSRVFLLPLSLEACLLSGPF